VYAPGVRWAWSGSRRSLHQRLAEALDALQALLDVGHAGGVAETDVIIGAEGDAGDGCDFLGFEQPRTEVGGLQPGLRDVREQVKGALDVYAADAREAVELRPGIGAALVEFGQPELEMVLRAGESGDGALARARPIPKAVSAPFPASHRTPKRFACSIFHLPTSIFALSLPASSLLAGQPFESLQPLFE
jgi:hypothetical protein